MNGRSMRAQDFALARHDTEVASDRWFLYATCREVDPDIFYPDKGESVALAKKICAVCPVVDRCLDHAIDANEAWGVWGGLSRRERQAVTGGRRASLILEGGANTEGG